MAKRMNENWEIIMGVHLPAKYGERPCEVVIGDRHTEFEPFVAWHCFGGDSYAWGHYCDTLEEATEEAIAKVKMELRCSAEYAQQYWNDRHADWREEE